MTLFIGNANHRAEQILLAQGSYPVTDSPTVAGALST